MTEHEGTLPEAHILAYTLSEAVADQECDAAQEYLLAFMDELFQLESGLRQHFSDALLGELKEEIRREAGTLAGYPVAISLRTRTSKAQPELVLLGIISIT